MSHIKTTVADFRQWVKPALKTAGTDKDPPVLTAAQIEIASTYALMFTADRYTASASRLRYERNRVRSITVLIYAADLTRVLQVFRRGTSELTIKATRARVTFASDGIEMAVPTLAAEADAKAKETGKPHKEPKFPNIKRLFAEAAQKPADEAFAAPMVFRFDFLTRFAAAAPRAWREPTVIQQAAGGPSRPYLIRIGEDFLGLLMPRRFLEGSSAKDAPLYLIAEGWHDALGITAADTKEQTA